MRQCPLPAALGQMLILLKLLLPEVAAHQRVAVLIHPVNEVQTGPADLGSLRA